MTKELQKIELGLLEAKCSSLYALSKDREQQYIDAKAKGQAMYANKLYHESERMAAELSGINQALLVFGYFIKYLDDYRCEIKEV